MSSSVCLLACFYAQGFASVLTPWLVLELYADWQADTTWHSSCVWGEINLDWNYTGVNGPHAGTTCMNRFHVWWFEWTCVEQISCPWNFLVRTKFTTDVKHSQALFEINLEFKLNKPQKITEIKKNQIKSTSILKLIIFCSFHHDQFTERIDSVFVCFSDLMIYFGKAT